MKKLKTALAAFSKKTISLSELETITKSFFQTYEEFSQTLLTFEQENILTMVQSKGRTTRIPSLAFQYRINKNLIVKDYHLELQHYRRILHTSINLDEYYRKDPSLWHQDLPYLLKIHEYVTTYGFPAEAVPAPERSFELVEDEKWIVEKGGKEVLECIGLYERLKIIPVSEPLMFAINPIKLDEQDQYHLIVENKTTYQGLLPAIKDTVFSTLIYGSGKTVVKSIEQFSMQYPINANHHFFYFGDIDYEGISIWHSLNKRQPAQPAIRFYQHCLEKRPAEGKAYQRPQKEALEHFLPFFPRHEQAQIQLLLEKGLYHPQETLKTRELQQIWRETDWIS
ncbi:Wadjet anti-phage system protein JetD domain-containing protein [Neobacillus jeddahensis]|uniref:Wadjet anti-phage system protein JetD domain-containing protein n=1 Tax=Neobacillus jeddahensis TaxID=1461580 RepID=UPI00058F53F7|nr:Wadjet anti-phage system protein JetD domain-containing protein [Neobacillus jeddahensis]